MDGISQPFPGGERETYHAAESEFEKLIFFYAGQWELVAHSLYYYYIVFYEPVSGIDPSIIPHSHFPAYTLELRAAKFNGHREFKPSEKPGGQDRMRKDSIGVYLLAPTGSSHLEHFEGSQRWESGRVGLKRIISVC